MMLRYSFLLLILGGASCAVEADDPDISEMDLSEVTDAAPRPKPFNCWSCSFPSGNNILDDPACATPGFPGTCWDLAPNFACANMFLSPFGQNCMGALAIAMEYYRQCSIIHCGGDAGPIPSP
jgi:hypothetical protein